MNMNNRINAIKAYERQRDGGIFMKLYKKNRTTDTLQFKIKTLNMELNDYDYGIVINDKPVTDKIDYKKYKTLSIDEFEHYKLGTCWDYTEYEAHVFQTVFNMKVTTSKVLCNNYFSMYYMQHIDKNGDLPSHTWIGYRLENQLYSFESAWKSIAGVIAHKSETEMMNYYLRQQEEYCKSKNNKLYEYEIVKYTPMPRYGLDPDEFMEIIYRTGNVVRSTMK